MCMSTKGQNWPIMQHTSVSTVLWVPRTGFTIYGLRVGLFPYVSGIHREIERKNDDPNQMKKSDTMFMLQH